MRRLHPLLLTAIAVAAVCCLARLGTLPLIQPDEGRNAEVAREMDARGAWLVPTYDGLPVPGQAGLLLPARRRSRCRRWARTRRRRASPARWPRWASSPSSTASPAASYGERAAALAVLVVGTTPLVIAFARIVIFDMVLALFVIAAVFAGYVAEEQEGAARTRWYLLGAACAGGRHAGQGPGRLPPAGAGPRRVPPPRPGAAARSGRLFAPANILVFLAIVLPWFLGVAHQRPDFPYYGLVEESLHRFTSPQFHRSAPFWYYVPVIAGVFFPWSILLPESAVAAWRSRARWARADRLLIAWVLVAVVFFSVSQSKLPGYVLTAVVALGILVARVLDLAFEQPDGRARRLVIRGAIALAVIAAAGHRAARAGAHRAGRAARPAAPQGR